MLDYIGGIVLLALGISLIYTAFSISGIVYHINMTEYIENTKELITKVAISCGKTMLKALIFSGLVIVGMLLAIWGCNIIVWN